MPEQPRISVQEAVRRLGVSKMSVYRWAREGRIGAVRIGQVRIMLDEADVNAMVQPLVPRNGE